MAVTDRERTQQSLLELARQDPQLAGRLLMTGLPVAVAAIPGRLRFRLDLEDVGTYDVSVLDGEARVIELDRVPDHVVLSAATPAQNGDQPTAEQPTLERVIEDTSISTELVAIPDGKVDFELRTDPLTLVKLAAGANPLRLMMGGKLKIRGKRRRALRLRQMATGLSMREVARAGVDPDPDLLYRALPYSVDGEWTRGHSFCISYTLLADEYGEGGSWYMIVDDGRLTVAGAAPASGVDSVVSLYHETWLQIVRGDLQPGHAMRRRLTQVDGKMFPVTLFGRWVERAEGRDGRELERERRQSETQQQRATWGSRAAGESRDGNANDDGKPQGVQLLSYEELYALWERQGWKAHEIDFTVDKQHWLATPTAGQRDTLWSLSSFYLGEERVAADLAPFVLAAPSGEAEVFLATQLVDEARHAVFFDRFMAEVMAVEPEDMRSRLAALEVDMVPAWKEMFDDQLRDISHRILDHPDDLDLFVEGIVVYHLVIEGVLAMTGQNQILRYMENHDIYPGFCQGFAMVERDEHRHIAFGVRFLRDAVESNPDYKDLIVWKIGELVPRAAHVFVPPGVKDPSDFMSYDYHSSEIYGFAYRALKRRMKVIGVEIPSAEELMPGPIDQPALPAAA